MVQVLAVVVMVVLMVTVVPITEALSTWHASARVLAIHIAAVLILLYRKMRPRADVAEMSMISAFGEIKPCRAFPPCGSA